MDVKYLGTGHAYEAPNSNCECDTCDAQRASGDPRDRRTNTSLAIKGVGEDYLLIDVGDFKMQQGGLRSFLEREEGESIAKGLTLLLTHSHPDHVGGIGEFDSVVRGGNSIPTYAHELCFGRLEEMDFGFLFKFGGVLERQPLRMNETYRFGEFDVRPFKVDHRSPIAPGAVGFVIDSVSEGKRLVYTGDFATMEDPSVVTRDNKPINLLIAEANWFNQLDGRKDHMSFQELLPYIGRWNPDRLQLVHQGADDELTSEDDASLVFKKRAVNPLLDRVPRTHREWEGAVRKVFLKDSSLKRYLSQEDIITYDGLTVGV